jgi:hypothetical protein
VTRGRAGLLVCALLLPSSAGAQEWSAELFASQLTHAPYGSFAAEAGVGGALTRSARSNILSLAGGRTLSAGGPSWASLSLHAWPGISGARGGFRWVMDGSAFAFVGDEATGRGEGLLARTGPGGALALGPMSIEAAALYGVNAMRWDEAAWTRTAPELRARLGLSPGAGIVLGVSGRAVQAEEGLYGFAGGEAAWSGEMVGAWARAGQWSGAGFEADAAVGGWLRASTGTELRVMYQQAAPDPLMLDPARRGWTLSLSHPVGARPHHRLPPLQPAGAIAFRIGAREVVGQPYLLGDFSGWEPLPMRREGESWVVTLQLDRGIYLYVFRSAAGEVFLPRSVTARRPDGMGGENGVLVVQ